MDEELEKILSEEIGSEIVETETVIPKHMPWIEKYRPRHIEDIVSQNHIIEPLKKFVAQKKIPNMLFYGPPGTGKTTTIRACAKELYGKNYPLMVLEINASGERGIEMVRTLILDFIKRTITISDNTVPFKIIVLDEVDAMTQDAQQSLRRIIEKCSLTTRFCLICNNIKKINLALRSRCFCFRFSQIDPNVVRQYVEKVARKEHVDITEDGYDELMEKSGGDMRKILDTMQFMKMLNKQITSDNVNECTGYPKQNEITVIFEKLANTPFAECYEYISRFIKGNSYSIADVVKELVKRLDKELTNPTLFTHKQVLQIFKQLGSQEVNLSIDESDNKTNVSIIVGSFKLAINNKNIRSLFID